MFKLIFILSVIAYVSSASVKREEFNTDPLLALTSQVTGNRESPSVSSNNNSPVYNPSNSNGGYSSYSSNFANSAIVNTGQNTGNLVSNNPSSLNYGNQPDSTSNQAFVDNLASAASNLPTTNQNQNQPDFTNNQGNLYYYYYPVQDKNKEISYQASPSNQYPSTIVQPQNTEDNSGSSPTNLSNNQQSIQGSNTPGHDLSYSGAQDLAYTASAFNENGNSPNANPSPSRNNYESQLSSLASALNQYGFNPSSSNNAFSAQFANQLSGFNNLGQNYGESYSGSIPQPSSVPFVNDPFSAAMASQLNGFQSGQPIQNANSGSNNGGPLSQLYQQATQVYQGLINGATGGSSSQPQFAASQQHASYEPSTANSLRSKYGLGTIIMPMLALAGLSLLIPTVTSLSTVASRKKRSSEGTLQNANLSPYFERIERYYSLYKNAVEKEECMNRIICELGDAVSNVRGKDALFGFVERMVPNGWMGSKVSVFKSGALSIDNAKCIKYKCH